MEADLLEIVELPSGEVVLRRVDNDDSPLVKISFSPESELLLQALKMEVARAMIEAGMHTYAEMNEVDLDFDEGSALIH